MIAKTDCHGIFGEIRVFKRFLRRGPKSQNLWSWSCLRECFGEEWGSLGDFTRLSVFYFS